MRPVTFFAAALLVVTAVMSGQAQRPGSSFPVIVVFKSEASLDQFQGLARADERAAADPDAWHYLDRGVLGATQSLEARNRFRADHVYSAAIRGFAARLSISQLAALEQNPLVDYIELDGDVWTTAQTLPWGIDRINADASSTQAGDGSGTVSGVTAYIIDTGVDTGHADLNVVGHRNFAGGQNRDCNGHGTHVAGTVGARDNTSDVVGVAPGVSLYGVKVLGCNGSGSISGVVKGVDWVTANRVLPAVANMSLGGGANTSLDNAVKNLAASGVVVAVAAGNSGANACNASPARAGTTNGVVTVAATDSNNREPSWSNYGSCVDIWAPGASVLSTKRGGGTTTMSGTSMASPHVAGTAALFLAGGGSFTAAQAEQSIKGSPLTFGTTSKDSRAIVIINAGQW